MKNDQKFNENKKIRTNFDSRFPLGFEQAKLRFYIGYEVLA